MEDHRVNRIPLVRGDYFVIFCADPGAEIQGFRADMFSPGRSAAALRCLRCLAGPSWPGRRPPAPTAASTPGTQTPARQQRTTL